MALATAASGGPEPCRLVKTLEHIFAPRIDRDLGSQAILHRPGDKDFARRRLGLRARAMFPTVPIAVMS